jgi:arginine decarboxylase
MAPGPPAAGGRVAARLSGRRGRVKNRLDHSRTPVLDALAAYHRRGYVPFTPPGHKQGRGTDPRVREVLGSDVFASDVLAVAGLDDRTSSGRAVAHAEELMADAVDADRTFFTTCGSSLSVKSAMLAVARPHHKLVISRDAHKSVVSGLVLSGIEPVWVDPHWDQSLHRTRRGRPTMRRPSRSTPTRPGHW